MWLKHIQPRFWPQILTLALFLHTYPDLIIQITCNFLQWMPYFFSLGNYDMLFQTTHEVISSEKPFPDLRGKLSLSSLWEMYFFKYVCLLYKTSKKKTETAFCMIFVMLLNLLYASVYLKYGDDSTSHRDF